MQPTSHASIDYGILKLASTTVSFIIRFPLLSRMECLLFRVSLAVFCLSVLPMSSHSWLLLARLRVHFQLSIPFSSSSSSHSFVYASSFHHTAQMCSIQFTLYSRMAHTTPSECVCGSGCTVMEFCLQLVCACCSHSSRPPSLGVTKTSLYTQSSSSDSNVFCTRRICITSIYLSVFNYYYYRNILLMSCHNWISFYECESCCCVESTIEDDCMCRAICILHTNS